MGGSSFLESETPEGLLLRSLASHRAGDLQDAIYWTATAAQVAGGASFFESHGLLAALYKQAGHVEAAMECWDKMVTSAPQKLQWLEAALREAIHTPGPIGEKYLGRWRSLLERVYTATPSLPILESLEQRGLPCRGALGIYGGQLRGWMWLPRGEKPRFSHDVPTATGFKLALQPVSHNASHICYEFCEELPRAAFRLTLETAAGVPLAGSPLVCSPPEVVKATGHKTSGKGQPPAVVTVLIPVYGDAEATLSCLGAVFASLKKNRCQAQVMVAWDCGPDEGLLKRLRRLAMRGKIRLTENAHNLGFLASVNQALGQIPRGDVILLNADTLVHGDWVDRLVDAAKKPDTATVTALGNEAELMSYPSHADRGKIKRLRQVAILDEAAASIPPEEAVLPIPVGVGFCMLITRKALGLIQGLDGWNICRGYGEESHYCLRAQAKGLRNYGCYNVFVGHLGERSFGLAKKALAAQNNLVIHEQYPHYRREYELFLHHEAPRQLRRKVALNTLSQLGTLPVLEIRPWSGRLLPPWVKDEKQVAPRQGAALFLRPGRGGRALLRIWAEVPIMELPFQLENELEELKAVLALLTFEKLVCHVGGEGRSLCKALGLELEEAGPLSCHYDAYEGPVPGALLLSPPTTMAGFQQLQTLRHKWSATKFFVFHLDTLWPNAALGDNVRELPHMGDFSALGAAACIMLDNYADAEGWRQWLDSHNAADLPLFCGVGHV